MVDGAADAVVVGGGGDDCCIRFCRLVDREYRDSSIASVDSEADEARNCTCCSAVAPAAPGQMLNRFSSSPSCDAVLDDVSGVSVDVAVAVDGDVVSPSTRVIIEDRTIGELIDNADTLDR